MVELDDNGLFKYRTYQDFLNNENNPISLFEEKTSAMSLSLVDAEKVVPIESEDLFFDLVKQNDSSGDRVDLDLRTHRHPDRTQVVIRH